MLFLRQGGQETRDGETSWHHGYIKLLSYKNANGGKTLPSVALVG